MNRKELFRLKKDYKPKDIFKHDKLGIKVVVGKDISDKDVKLVVDKLLGIVKIFKEKKITLDLSEIFSNLVIISSELERNIISPAKGWDALYKKNKDAIIIDIEKCRDKKTSNTGSYEYVDYVLVHEIGHALHLKYMADSSKQYYDDITRVFLKQISFRKNLIKKTEESAKESKESKDDIIKKIMKSEISKEKSVDSSFTLNFKNVLPNNLKKLYVKKSKQISRNKGLYELIKSSIEVLKDIMPSEYGTLNLKEDFAENFVLFILNPESLDQWNINRLQNTMAKTRAQGKTIIKANKNYNLLKSYIQLLM